MAVTKVLARGWQFEVETAVALAFVDVKGLTEFGFSPTKNDVDSTDFDSAGWEEHIVASRGLEISLTGYFLEDAATGSRDPGQERIEAVGLEVGAASIGKFKMTSPGGTVWSFNASVDATSPAGGGTDDNTGWEVSLRVNGKPVIA